MLVKLVILTYAITFASGIPQAKYPAGISPESCPDYPLCSDPFVAIAQKNSLPTYQEQGSQRTQYSPKGQIKVAQYQDEGLIQYQRIQNSPQYNQRIRQHQATYEKDAVVPFQEQQISPQYKISGVHQYQNQASQYHNQEPQYQNQEPQYQNQYPQFQNQDPQYQSQGYQYQNQDSQYQNQDVQNQNRDPQYQIQFTKYQVPQNIIESERLSKYTQAILPQKEHFVQYNPLYDSQHEPADTREHLQDTAYRMAVETPESPLFETSVAYPSSRAPHQRALTSYDSQPSGIPVARLSSQIRNKVPQFPAGVDGNVCPNYPYCH